MDRCEYQLILTEDELDTLGCMFAGALHQFLNNPDSIDESNLEDLNTLYYKILKISSLELKNKFKLVCDVSDQVFKEMSDHETILMKSVTDKSLSIVSGMNSAVDEAKDIIDKS